MSGGSFDYMYSWGFGDVAQRRALVEHMADRLRGLRLGPEKEYNRDPRDHNVLKQLEGSPQLAEVENELRFMLQCLKELEARWGKTPKQLLSAVEYYVSNDCGPEGIIEALEEIKRK